MSDRYLILTHYETGKGSVAFGGDGSLSYLVYSNTDETLQAKTALGIEEFPAGSTDYRVAVPKSWSGVIEWYLGSSVDSIASERFDAEPEGVFGGPSDITFALRYADGSLASGVTFVIAGVGPAITGADGTITVGLVDGSYSVSVVPTAGVLWPTRSFAVFGTDRTITITGTASAGEPLPPAGSGRTITLNRFKIANANHYHLRAFRLRVEVESVSGGMDRNVFLFRIRPANPETGLTPLPDFQTVCSPVDMEDYPVGGADPSLETTHFRGDAVELDVRSTTQYDQAWATIRDQVCSLVNALNRLDILVVAETFRCGESEGATESDSSSSSSGSGASSSSESLSVSA